MTERDQGIEAPVREGEGQAQGAPGPVEESAAQIPAFGRRALRELRRELTDEELANPGVQKLILDALEHADVECEELQPYRERFHAADKRAAVLEEKLKKETGYEILFNVGIGVGGAIVGVTPYFWQYGLAGILSLAIGIILIVGSIVARLVSR